MNHTASEDLTVHERLAILLARELRDGEIGAWGAGGLIPMAAVLLAKRTHAPNLRIGGERIYEMAPDQLIPSIDDQRQLAGAIALESFWEIFGHWHKGLDFFFFSGMQIDPFGNLNLHLIRRGGREPIRGPGVANISLAGSCRRTLLYMTEHSPRRFVPSLDFRSLPGHLEGGSSRERLGLRGGGPEVCVTPLGVFDFPGPEHRMRLRSVHQGVSTDEIERRTGFPVVPDETRPTTPEPSADEIEALRTYVDPKGALRTRN